MVSREARGNRVRWMGVCTWYFQCGFCWLSSVCVLEGGGGGEVGAVIN